MVKQTKPLFYLTTALNHKSNDAGILDMLKRSHTALPWREKVNILDLLKKEKEAYAGVAKAFCKKESSVCEIRYCSILFLVIVVNLFLSLIYKFNFILGM